MSEKKRGKTSSNADPHRSREQERYESPIASREYITSVLKEEKGPIDFEALAERLSLEDDPQAMEALRRRVGAMLRDGQLIQNRKRGLVPVEAASLVAGRISAHPDGFGFVITDDDQKDIYLNGKQMRQVLHGDRVVVCITGTDRRGRREGRVVDVVERANQTLVGRLSIDRGTVVVIPDNKRIHQELLIAPGELAAARDGDMVVAEIVEQPSRRHQPVGKVIEVLGQSLRPGMEIDVALHSHGIPSEWPQAVIDQAAGFAASVDADAAGERKDVRDVPLITIDGVDARDFDDAVWCERLKSGWRLFVAIADVAHYVEPDSPLDVEAVERGTSVYFPGRVVPMLPEALSNGLCSLNPDVDRLCMLCELTLDKEGEVRKTRFHNAIMRSHARLTYDQVHEMLTEPGSALRERHASLVPMIEELHRLYEVLADRRRQRGAIEFESNETFIVFDESKKIREIVPIQRNDAHKLIEECMILANIQAAAFLEEREMPALYRVHAGPKADRLVDLRAFLALRGLTLAGGESPTALDYAALAEDIKDLPDRSVIQTVMLRSMQQAVYQPENDGHFGLALEQYAHFTSPIRRYPDLLVHRAIKHVLARRKAKTYRYSTARMQEFGESCSMTERRAEEASRDVVSWLKCEYMQEHVGSDFDGVISAVTSFGLFVELTGIHVEGLVHITNLPRDYYRFEQAAHSLIGERTGRQYHLGDALRVRVAGVNLEERKIDFTEVEQPSRRRRGRDVGVRPDAVQAEQSTDQSQPRKVKSAEQRRQEKRRRKQNKRDRKRAAMREARDEAARLLQQNAPEPAAGKASVISPVSEPLPGKDDSPGDKAEERSAVESNKATPVTESESMADKGPASTTVPGSDSSASEGASKKKATARKTAAGKAVAKKTVSTRAVTKKSAGATASTGEVATKKKAATGKATSKKATTKKLAGTGVATGKVSARKKVATKKATSKKVQGAVGATGKVATRKKVAAKKTSATRVASRVAAGSASADVAGKVAASRKASAKKVASKKAASKKAVSKKAVSKKAVSKKAASKKVVSKKAAAAGVATGKVVAKKKAVAKKAATSKVAAGVASGKVAARKKASAKKSVSGKASGRGAAGGKVTAKKKSTSKRATRRD